jgi:hypothetical protein
LRLSPIVTCLTRKLFFIENVPCIRGGVGMEATGSKDRQPFKGEIFRLSYLLPLGS